jgi:hypothetical protein
VFGPVAFQAGHITEEVGGALFGRCQANLRISASNVTTLNQRRPSLILSSRRNCSPVVRPLKSSLLASVRIGTEC